MALDEIYENMGLCKLNWLQGQLIANSINCKQVLHSVCPLLEPLLGKQKPYHN